MNNRFLSGRMNNSGNGDGAEMAAVSDEMLHEIWARRAAQLAKAPTDEEAGEQLDLVIVQLGAELYGLEAAYVFRIRPAEQITQAPHVPDWVAGIANDRGNILSVFDLRRFLGLDAVNEIGEIGSEETLPYLVVVQAAEMELALLADAVLNVIALPLSALEAAPEMMHGIPQEYIKGVVHQKFEWRVDGREIDVLTVLDLPALLSDEALVVREEIA
ncbi:MAG: chemotaxis protein CheW [Anaerolineales bacterium]